MEGNDLIKLTDQESGLYLSRWRDSYLVETTSRGEHRTRVGEFNDQSDAERFLVSFESRQRRRSRDLDRVRVPAVAEGVELEQTPTAIRLTWADGRTAEFTATLLSEIIATEFSWVVRASLAEIAASYDDPDGRPLFAAA